MLTIIIMYFPKFRKWYVYFHNIYSVKVTKQGGKNRSTITGLPTWTTLWIYISYYFLLLQLNLIAFNYFCCLPKVPQTRWVKKEKWGIPWRSSCYVLLISLPRARVQFLVGDVRSCNPCNVTIKRERERERERDTI